jgi:hypothetical protein
LLDPASRARILDQLLGSDIQRARLQTGRLWALVTAFCAFQSEQKLLFLDWWIRRNCNMEAAASQNPMSRIILDEYDE